MAESDLSRIVGLIMENPKLIEEIKSLGAEKGSVSNNTEEAAETEVMAQDTPKEAESTPVFSAAQPQNEQRSRRRDLLCALKPYVSNERSRAIESMLSIADILDMMKTR